MYLQKVWLVAISMDLEGNYLLRLLIEGISHAIFLHIARIPSCNLMSNCNKREETFRYTIWIEKEEKLYGSLNNFFKHLFLLM